MKISTFFYVLRQGFANIRRNILFSLASLGTIISCLFLFGIIYAVVVNFQSGMQELEKTVTISVFFDEDASDETIQLIGEQIRTVDYVETMDFISADEAWDKFADQNYDDPQVAKNAFGGDNPLKNAASCHPSVFPAFCGSTQPMMLYSLASARVSPLFRSAGMITSSL